MHFKLIHPKNQKHHCVYGLSSSSLIGNVDDVLSNSFTKSFACGRTRSPFQLWPPPNEDVVDLTTTTIDPPPLTASSSPSVVTSSCVTSSRPSSSSPVQQQKKKEKTQPKQNRQLTEFDPKDQEHAFHKGTTTTTTTTTAAAAAATTMATKWYNTQTAATISSRGWQRKSVKTERETRIPTPLAGAVAPTNLTTRRRQKMMVKHSIKPKYITDLKPMDIVIEKGCNWNSSYVPGHKRMKSLIDQYYIDYETASSLRRQREIYLRVQQDLIMSGCRLMQKVALNSITTTTATSKTTTKITGNYGNDASNTYRQFHYAECTPLEVRDKIATMFRNRKKLIKRKKQRQLYKRLTS